MEKRKSFGSVLLKQGIRVFLVTIVLSLLVLGSFASEKKKEARQWHQKGYEMVERSVNGYLEYDWEEKEKQGSIQFGLAYATSRRVMSVMYDADTKEEYASCKEKLFLFKKVEADEYAKFMYCDVEKIPGWEEYREKTKDAQNFSKVREDEYIRNTTEDYTIYTDGIRFLPKQLNIKTYSVRSDEFLMSAEEKEKKGIQPVGEIVLYAPEIPEGYREEITEAYDFKHIVAMGYSEYALEMNRDTSDDKSYELLMDCYRKSKSGITWEVGTYETFLSLKITSEENIRLGKDKKYVLVTAMCYDVWDIYKEAILLAALGVFVVSCLLSFVLAKASYSMQKSKYDMEDYRRTLMNTMAHDLKSPLMSISGYAENLRDNVLSEKRVYYAESIIDNVQYMNHMIESILSLSRTEKKTVVLKKEDIAVEEVLQTLIEKQELWIKERQLTIDVEGKREVKADRTLFVQAMSNLLDNAVKYAGEGSRIAITLDAEGICFQNPCTEDLSAVIDTLCEPFVMGDSSRGNRKGSGLGLSIVKKICKLHGFTLGIACAEGCFEARIKL